MNYRGQVDEWVIMKSWSEMQMIETNPNLKKKTEQWPEYSLLLVVDEYKGKHGWRLLYIWMLF